MSAYQTLEAAFARHSSLKNAAAILQWDAAVMLPPGSADTRGAQLGALYETMHGIITDPAMADWLAQAEGERGLDDWQRANLREMQRIHAHETAIPARLVAELAKITTESEMRWREARANNDFAAYAPVLERVLMLTREAAAAKAGALGVSPYDALIDQYDPGSRIAQIDPVFDDLAAFLPAFTQEVLERQAMQPAPLPLPPVPLDAQRRLSRLLMEKLGFDFTKGRCDESAHPFCGGVPGDIRLTTRYSEGAFLSGMFGIIHETGHAVYEMHLPEAWRAQPVGEARGMTAHESQSLFFEKQIGHHSGFFRFLAPLVREAFGLTGKEWEPENLERLANRVERGFIRVEADEVTYPSHILLRYRLEKALFSGDLDVAGLPAAWADGMRELLGITPPNDALGCLQDIHWPGGSFGYFPSYTLGAMLAAQCFRAMERELPQAGQSIARGEFALLTGWLEKRIHARSSLLPTPGLIQEATGKPLDAAIYKAHLTQRYLP